MKKLVATLFLLTLIAASAFGQTPPPTLRIVTEAPGLPSELFYGDVKVKPLRLRPCPPPPTPVPCTPIPITIADYDFFIQQQYIDFLRRFPEPAGLQFYLDILNGCNSSDIECIKFTKGALAANFFRSPEFQRKGSYVMYLYMVTLGQRPATVAELSDPTKIDRPHYTEFMTDLQAISDPNDQGTDAKKTALTIAWLQRPEIQAIYGALTNQQFVDTLVARSHVTLSNPTQYVNQLDNGVARHVVLRAIVESAEVNTKYYKPAFVTMQYFGFLRRDPEVCVGSPNPSQCGYIFHNDRFNLPADQPFLENTMVRGFTESPEYFNRF